MNKAELIKSIAKKSGMSQEKSGDFLEAFLNVVSESLEGHERVAIMGFGAFDVKKRAARIGRNPKTNETVHIPKSYAPVFKASQLLKEKVNE